jgi:hypothetical protein
VGPGAAGAKGRGRLKLCPPLISSRMRTMMRRIVSMVITSQRLIDLVRSWRLALVASIVSLYSLGDLVYGFL